MKNLLRILMLVLIIGAVFFAGDFLMNQNENYEFNNETNVEDIAKQEASGEELLENLLESGDEIFSGETDIFSGEAEESGESAEITENIDESDTTSFESGDEIVETVGSGEVTNN